MPTHTMTTWQWLPCPRDEVFGFFSDARNLQWGPGLVTRLINKFLVAPDTKRIFEFRHQALEEIFGVKNEARAGEVTFA